MTECVKIRCDDCKFVENCVDYGWQECKKFTPKPSEPMTNEEYLRSAGTDGLTAIFMQFMFDAEFKARFVNGNFITEFRKWLKEIHE